MLTSVHIPSHLLKQTDQRAHALGISRNRLIIRALERELATSPDWSPGFFDRLRATDNDLFEAVEEMHSALKRDRRSKSPRNF